MVKKQKFIIQFFHYLWLVISVAIILFILSQAFYTKRSLEYNLDFFQPVGRDIIGWYPENRIKANSREQMTGDFDLLAEPIYMKIYTPINFDKMTVQGGIYPEDQEIKLGIRNKNGFWDFQKLDIENFYFSLDFDLQNAQIRNNHLEIILSIPDMMGDAKISLANNWKIFLSR